MRKLKELLFKNRHVLDVESALNQEVGTTIPAIVNDLQEDNVSGYSAYEFIIKENNNANTF